MRIILPDFFPPESVGAIVAYADGLDMPQLEMYGFADLGNKKPFSSSSIFDVASVTKTFTGAAIALLHQRGELDVKLPLETYLPILKVKRKSRLVKLQDLLWHTSGLPDYLEHFEQEQFSNLRNKDIVEFTKKCIGGSQVGLECTYSNTNYVLLASVIEKVSGQSYADFLQNELFEPLGLKSTYVTNPCRTSDMQVKGYEKNDDGEIVPSQQDIFVLGDGGIFSTILDLVIWVQSYFRERLLLTKKSIDCVFSNGQTDSGQSTGYGYGIVIKNNRRVQRFGHTGSWIGVSTFVGYDVATDKTVIVLSNLGNAPVLSIAQSYFNQLV